MTTDNHHNYDNSNNKHSNSKSKSNNKNSHNNKTCITSQPCSVMLRISTTQLNSTPVPKRMCTVMGWDGRYDGTGVETIVKHVIETYSIHAHKAVAGFSHLFPH